MPRTYTVQTVETTPFDTYLPYADGGPVIVVRDGWSTSYSSLCRAFSSKSAIDADDGKITLNASATSLDGSGVKHPLDGTKYDTMRDAIRAAYEAGLTGFMVYDGKTYARPLVSAGE